MKKLLLFSAFALLLNIGFSSTANISTTTLFPTSNNSFTNGITKLTVNGIKLFAYQLSALKKITSGESKQTVTVNFNSNNKNESNSMPLARTVQTHLESFSFLADNNGDYRSKGIGPAVWNSAASWEVFDGVSWINATTYPGQIAGNYDVSIQSGHTITIQPASPFIFSTQQTGNLNIDGTLILGDGVSTGNTQNTIRSITLNTNKLTIGSNGVLNFNNNKIELKLPDPNALIIVQGGTQGGNITSTLACNPQVEIYIGNSLYAICQNQGNGNTISFGNIVAAGGTINAEITAPTENPIKLCGLSELNFSGTYIGTETNVSYEWKVNGNTIGSGNLANSTSSTTIAYTPQSSGQFLVEFSVTSGNFTNIETRTLNATSLIDFANLQSPFDAEICLGASLTAYGQVYEEGVTETAGPGAGIVAQFGYSTENTNPSTWTTWDDASFNSQVGNNDQYQFAFTPTTIGTFYYTFRYSINGCEWQYGGTNNGFWNGTGNNSGVLTVLENHELSLTSGDTNQTLCPNTNISNIVYTFGGGATGAAVSGLPNGVSGTLSGNTFTISGTPTQSGTFNYTVATTGTDCVSLELSGTIEVQQLIDFANLQSPFGAEICLGSSLTAFGQVYEEGITETNGPGAGIVAQFGYNTANTNPSTWTIWDNASYNTQGGTDDNNDEYQYTFTPTTIGNFYYTFRYSLDGCEWQYGGTNNGFWNGTGNNSGVLTVLENHELSLTSGDTNQTLCPNTDISNIVYTFGGGATGANVSGLPNGVSGTLSGNTFTISGTPTQSGTFNYSVTTTGNSCTVQQLSGIIDVQQLINFANLQSPFDAEICLGGSLTASGQVYEPGVTEAVGPGAGIVAQFGYNTANTNPSTWNTWENANYNTQGGINDNNDEYQYTFTPNSTGTFYYTFRYALNGCEWQYGGTNDGFWNGTGNNSGVLTVLENHELSLTSGDTNQTLCPNTDISNIVYTFGGGATGANVSGLPNGVSGTLSGNTFTISGTPTQSGTFNYSVTTTGNICTAQQLSGTIEVQQLLDYANLQFPGSGIICLGDKFDVYGQVYEEGLTNATSGQAPGIVAQFGYSTANSNPATWTNWETASFNVEAGNNDEYKYEFTPASTGTFYYTFRYALNGCEWQYGGYTPNGGGFLGGDNVVGVLTVNETPVITTVYNAISVNTDNGICGAIVNYTNADVTGVPAPSITYSTPSGAVFPVGTTTVTVEASNLCGTVSTTFDVTVTDNQIPVINNTPANISVNTDLGSCDAVVTWTAPAVSDNCPGATISSNFNPGDTFPIGTTTVTYNAQDANNNNAVSTSFTVTVIDNEIPVINNTPANISVNTDLGGCEAIVSWTAPTVSDNCPGATISSNFNPGDTFPIGTTTVTYNAQDANDNNAVETSFTVTVIDNEIPVITTNGNQTVNSDAGECSALVEVSASATDNCSVIDAVVGVRDDGLALNAAYPVGETTIAWNVQDVNGNNALEVTQIITVVDNEAPTAVCQDITVELDANGQASITADQIDNGSTDNCEIASISIDKDTFDCEDLLGEATTKVVISQVYGGGGNSGATFTNDFIELFNSGNTPVDLNGWSVQYASSAGSSWAVTALTGTIQPGQYYLIQQAAGSGGTVALPTPDAVGTIAMAASNGKVLLANTTDSQSGTCPTGSQIIDFVGFGSANCFEGSGATPTLSNTTAAIRNNSCIDTDNNAADFSAVTPNPRNSSSALSPCFSPSNSISVPVTLTVTDVNGKVSTCIANVTVTDNILPVISTNGDKTVDSDAGECGAIVEVSATAADNCSVGQPVGTRDDDLALSDPYPVGETTITWNVQDVNGNPAAKVTQTIIVKDNEAPIAICKDIPVELDENGVASITAEDIDNGSTDNCEIDSISIDKDSFDCEDLLGEAISKVVISQVYGGGGNSGAPFNRDFVELFNSGTTAVNLSGWSVQYAAVTGTNWSKTDLTNFNLQPGQYYLIALGTNNLNVGNNLPTPNVTGSTNMSGINGKVLLTNTTTVQSGSCPTGTQIIDFVGFGGNTNCFEGNGPTANLSNTTAAIRNNSCTDTDNNSADFSAVTPNPRNSATALEPCFGVGGAGVSVTLTVTDIYGNSSSCVSRVTVLDVTAPELTAAADQDVNLDDNCSITVPNLIDGSSATDNCTVNITQFPLEGTVIASSHNETIEVTVTATDAAGNTDEAIVTLTAKDVTDPILTPVADQEVNLDENCSITVPNLVDGSSASDNCTVTITQSPLEGTVIASSHNGTIEVTLTATDAAGNTDEAIVTLTAKDVTDPILTPVEDQEVNLDENCSITVPNLVDDSSAFDNCTVTITQSPLAGTVIASSHNATIEVIVTATDAAGNKDEAIVNLTAKDVTNPVLTPVADQNVNLDENCSITVPDLVEDSSANDNCTVTINQSPLAGTVIASLHNQTIEVTVTATDAAGNTDEAAVTLTAKDVTNPIIECPANITINCEDDTSSVFTGEATGSDNCLDVLISQSDLSTQSSNPLNSDFYNYTITRTWTATDTAGNITKCDQIITVQDITRPVANCVNVTVTLDEDGNGSISVDDLNNNSSDNCSPVTLSLSRTNFDCSDIGGDLDELIISEYVDGTENNDWIEIYNGTGNTVMLGEIIGEDLVSDYSIYIYKDGATNPIKIDLYGFIPNRGTWKIAHSNADISEVSFDEGIPEIEFDGNDAIALVNNTLGVAVDIIGVIGQDPGPSGWTSGDFSTAGTTLVRNINIQQGNVSNFVAALPTEWTQFAQNDVSNIGSHNIEIVNSAKNVILTVTDVSGNVSECEANVFVVDNTHPVAICKDVTIQLDEFGFASTTPQAVDNGSDDACGIANLALSKTEFNCEDVGANQVTLTVTDSNGNTSTCTATVFVEDNVAPVVITKDITIELDANGNASIQPNDVNDGSSDACDIETLTVFPNTFDCANVGNNTVTLTATDNNGNTSSKTAIVTIQDNINPIAICKDITVQLDENGFVRIIGEDVNNNSTDACGIASYSVFPNEFGCDNIGENTVTLTVTDVNGNSSTCTAVVTVEGIIPTVTISQSELPEFCQGAVLVLSASTSQPNNDIRSYAWSGNGITGPTDDSSVSVSGNEIYTVTVTSETNCVTTESYTVTGFDAGDLISSYTILAFDDIFLHNSNLVASGAIGVTGTNGTVKLFQSSTVVGFGQASNFNLNQGSAIGQQINQPANPTLPDFVTNTLSNNTSPSVTIANGQSLTLNEAVYNIVTINQGATVTFNQSNVYINELRTSDGANIEFSGCANVFINTKFRLAQNGVINSFGNNVVFYVKEDVQIEKGSNVRARIYSNGGEIFAKGANARGNNAAEPTFMTGLFIASKVHGSINVIWQADEFCEPCAVNAPQTRVPFANVPSNGSLLDFDIVAWPNPSNAIFNVRLKTIDLVNTAKIMVYDTSNKLVHSGIFRAEEVYTFGDKLEGGVYIVEITQDKNSKITRFIKY